LTFEDIERKNYMDEFFNLFLV